jgi:hypothetical protein
MSQPFDFSDQSGFCYRVNSDGKTVTLLQAINYQPAAVLTIPGTTTVSAISAGVQNVQKGASYTVTVIATRAFYQNGGAGSFSTLVIDDGVLVLKEQSFASCPNLQTVVIPSTLTQMFDSAFDNSPVNNIVFLGNVPTLTPSVFPSNATVNIPVLNVYFNNKYLSSFTPVLQNLTKSPSFNLIGTVTPKPFATISPSDVKYSVSSTQAKISFPSIDLPVSILPNSIKYVFVNPNGSVYGTAYNIVDYTFSNLIPGTSYNFRLDIYINPLIQSLDIAFKTPPAAISNICFPAKTPILTDQGLVPIASIDTEVHTIKGEKIKAITKTVTMDPYLVCFEGHSLSRNYPSSRTVMTKDHKVMFNGKMVEAYKFVKKFGNVHFIKNTGELLYNVLMENHRKIKVNNFTCETLHPRNPIGKLYTDAFSDDYKNKIIFMLNDAIKHKKTEQYKKIANLI